MKKSDFKIVKQLGIGKFGKVYEVEYQGKKYAAKLLSKKLIDYNEECGDYLQDALKRDIDIYKELNFEFKYIIADEAQYIKNNNTQNAKTIKIAIGRKLTKIAIHSELSGSG